MKRFLVSAALLLVGACQPDPTPRIVGEWTPVNIDDCGSEGATVTITDRGLTYRAGRSELELIKIGGITQVESYADLSGRFRLYPPDPDKMWGDETTLRLEVTGNEVRPIGFVESDGTILQMDSGMRQVLTMRRCP
ncbi:hypothetical protein [Brevundimonas sp. SL161]|uniref:hypothetical protein n=1 Tax=Brevundimonas sp. SL161 TaxID=2804613 RepID=UPI003CF18022